MKKILFLIIATLLVIGLVLPGCGGGNGAVAGTYVFTDAKINVGIAGELTHLTGSFQMAGAQVAQAIINAGGVTIGGVNHQIVLVPIETGEATVDPAGAAGYSAMLDKIDDVHLILGGYRTEAVSTYREVAMDEKVIFIDCGAATEALSQSVVDNYNRYQYWFKATPPNEYFLGSTVVRMVDSVARDLRTACSLAANVTLNATIVSDELAWAVELVPVIENLLPDINVNMVYKTTVDPLLVNPTTWGGILSTMAAYDPHIIIPLLSGDAGVAYSGVRTGLSLPVMSVGINVPAQLNYPWAGTLNASSPGPNCAHEVLMDTWATGVNQTSLTAPFLTAFMGTVGDYPLYTAATYDALFALKAALEAVPVTDTEGVKSVLATDIVTWLENPANAQPTTTGMSAYYPLPGSTSGKSALSEAQVEDIYFDIAGYSWAYDVDEWLTPPHTAHDLVYGVGLQTGIGAQWQWDGGLSLWQKVGVWPTDKYSGDLTDQYGDWDFEYDGTVPLVLPAAVVTHHTP